MKSGTQHSDTPPLHHSISYTPHTLRADLKLRGALPANVVIALGLKFTAALAHLHKHGLVHRDVKPPNILFIGGEPMLADGGLVATVDDARSLVGTAGYIAPQGPGTPQADLYALGKVLYEAAFGKDRQEFPALPADVASRPDHARLLELNALLLKACAADTRERYQSADQMRADLELLRAGRSVKRRQAWQEARRLAVRIGAAAAAIIAAWFLFNRYNTPTLQHSNAPARTIAVLSFDDEDPGSPSENLGERLAEELRAGLSRVPGLGTIGRSSSHALKSSPNPLTAARTNKIGTLLDGRVRRQGDQLRRSLELTDMETGRLIWSDVLHGQVGDPFAVQISVSQSVPGALGIRLTDSQQARLAAKPTKILEAYRSYWEGRYATEKRTPDALTEAISHFQKATALDANFALAYAGLADCYHLLAQYGDRPPRAYEAVLRSTILKALELDPDLAEAHTSLAAFKETFEFDWAGAEAEYKRAIELNPNYPRARLWYSWFLKVQGRNAEGQDQSKRALELDPLSPTLHANRGHELRAKGRYTEAVAEYRKALSGRASLEIHYWLALSHEKGSRDGAALEAYDDYWLAVGESRENVTELRMAFAQGGWPAYWRKRVEQTERPAAPHLSWHFRAGLYKRLDNTTAVFDCLQHSYEDREFYATHIRLSFSEFRRGPRYAVLLRKMNLQQ